jgi:hypothetical protein
VSHGWSGPRPSGGYRPDLGIYVRSRWEANFARYLNFLVQVGDIVGWEYEPETFEFPVSRGNRFYKPDFRVHETNGTTTYYEVKGYMDRDSRVKLARMARYYPDRRVVVVDARFMADIRSIARLIEGWEE